MKARYSLLLALLGTGCSGADGAFESTAETSLALNACDETVPATRSVDGLPAYAQCDAVSSGNIWSNNGVDTGTSSLGSDWIETQRGGGYQCTEWAYRYMHFRWGVDYRHGDARQWCDGTLPSTLVKATAPSHGDLIVFDAGVCGADATTGHIAVIDTVDAAAGKVTIVEENEAARRTTNQSCGSCFLHAVANDGSNGGAAGASGGGQAGGGAQAGGGGAKMSGSAGRSGDENGGAAAAGGGVGAGRGGGGSAGTAVAGIGGAPTTSVGGVGVSAGAGGMQGMPSTVGGAPASSGIAGSSSLSSAGVSAAGATATSASSGGASGSSGWALTSADAPSIGAVSESPSAGCSIGSHAADHSNRRVSSALLLFLFGVARFRRGGASHRATPRAPNTMRG